MENTPTPNTDAFKFDVIAEANALIEFVHADDPPELQHLVRHSFIAGASRAALKLLRAFNAASDNPEQGVEKLVGMFEQIDRDTMAYMASLMAKIGKPAPTECPPEQLKAINEARAKAGLPPI